MAQRPIRLLMTTDAVGGVWQYATELAAGLAAERFDITLAVLGPSPDAAQQETARGIPGLTVLDTGLPLDWLSEPGSTCAAAGEIAALAAREGADLIHLNSPALAAEQPFHVPVLGVVHGCLATWWQAAHPGQPLDPAFRWHERMMARGLRACDRLIAPSLCYAELIRRVYRLPAAPPTVYNGRNLPAAVAPTPSHSCAFTAGRLWDEVKDTRTLDAVAARLPFPFHAAGAVCDPYGNATAIRHLRVLGHLDGPRLAQKLATRPVFVSAATFEPFGLAVLEAAASGCPLVLSDIRTFRELWDGAAVFVRPGDVAGFAAAIEECVEDVERRDALGEAAHLRAQRYSATRMTRATAAHYRALLETRQAA